MKRSGTQTIVDIWGKAHPVRSVDIILTRSQFKAYGWLRENGMTWEDYWDAFRDYNHALYITNLSKTEPEKLVELNYQFLSHPLHPAGGVPPRRPAGGLGPQSGG